MDLDFPTYSTNWTHCDLEEDMYHYGKKHGML
jgi:hypothetical protein